MEKSFDPNRVYDWNDFMSLIITDNNAFDAYGNVLDMTVSTLDEPLLDSFSTVRTISAFDNTPSQNWILGRLRTTAVTHSRRDVSGSMTRYAAYDYFASGLLKTEKVLTSPTTVARMKKYFYDDFGNVKRTATCSTQVSEAVCGSETAGPELMPSILEKVHRVEISEYDSKGRYVDRTKGFFNGQSGAITETQVLARDRFGSPTQVRNAAGVDQRFVYGNFGQPYYAWTETVPDAVLGASGQGVSSRTTRAYCQSNGGPAACPVEAVYRETVAVTGAPRLWLYVNALGEEVARVVEGFNAGGGSSRSVSMTCTARDLRRRTVEVTEPFSIGTVSAGGDPAAMSTLCSVSRPKTAQLFDMLDRPIWTVAPDGARTTFAYDELETLTTLPTTSTNSNPLVYRQRWQLKNVLGEVIMSRDPDPAGAPVTADWDGNGLPTQFTYDAIGNLTEVNRGASLNGQKTTMVYDALGRKVRQVDPDAGVWNYRYNVLGEQILQYDGAFVPESSTVPDDQTQIEQWFDARGRVHRRVSSGSSQHSDEVSTFVYDVGSTAQPGLLMSEAVAGAYENTGSSNHSLQRTYLYDRLGRQVGIRTFAGSGTYYERAHLDAYGRVRKTQDAAGGWLLAEYNAIGMTAATCDTTAASTATTCAAGAWQRIQDVNARGQVLHESRANGVEVIRTYDSVTGRIESLSSTAGTTELSIESYNWDVLGNLESRTRRGQYRAPYTERFEYDGMNRLTRGWMDLDLPGKSNLETLVLTYDQVGNICSRVGMGETVGGLPASASFVYGNNDCTPPASGNQIGLPGQTGVIPQTNRLTTMRRSATEDATFQYDAHGNQTSMQTANSVLRTTAYTAAQQAYLIVGQGREERFWYGPKGEKYRRAVSGVTNETTFYIGSVEVIQSSVGTTVFKRNIGGVAVQTISALAGTTLNETVVQDHLGSVVSLYSNATEPLPAANQMDYGPFGTRRLVSNPEQYGPGLVVTATDKGFTGHAMLDQLGVIHMGGRIYDPLQMRFMQADPFVQDPLSAQSYNRYLYLWNNPLNGTDPTGYLSVKERQWLGTIVAIVGTVFAPTLSNVWAKLAYISAVGAASGGITTGSWNGALQGAFTSTITAGVGGAGMPLPQQALANAFVGGAVSAMQGGKFGHGFVSAGLGTLAGPAINSQVKGPGGQIVAHALVGGSISAVTGGKFANGAATGAFRAALAVASAANRGTDVVGSGGPGGGGPGDPNADAFLQAESANAGVLFCSASCEASPEAAHAAAAGRYLGASIAARRESTWWVYDVGDGTFSFTYPSISGVGATQQALPSRLPGFSLDSGGHTHWDSNYQFSPQDWRLITQEARNGPGITLYLGSGDGSLQYSTPAHARGFAISRGASFLAPYSNFPGKVVPGVHLRTTYP